MDINYPKNWIEKKGTNRNDQYIAKNTETEVFIGVGRRLVSDSFAVWLGNDITDKSDIMTKIPSEELAKQKCVEYMRDCSYVDYKAGDLVYY